MGAVSEEYVSFVADQIRECCAAARAALEPLSAKLDEQQWDAVRSPR